MVNFQVTHKKESREKSGFARIDFYFVKWSKAVGDPEQSHYPIRKWLRHKGRRAAICRLPLDDRRSCKPTLQ